jgi:hypothetical protein
VPGVPRAIAIYMAVVGLISFAVLFLLLRS